MRSDQRDQPDVRLFVFADHVLALDFHRALRVVGSDREPAASELDHAQPPEDVRLRRLVALAPLTVDALQQSPSAVELVRPDEDIHR